MEAAAQTLARDLPRELDLLERELLPKLLADGRLLTVWSAGCGDGSELYGVAVLLDRLGALDRSLLLGTDPLEANVAVARRGVYRGDTVPRRLRARVRWEQWNLLRDGAPRGGWRLVLCRDATPALRAALVEALAPGGVLLLAGGLNQKLELERP